ncbi:hypothetical protein QVD17_05546 [Tagetes erecta]|uniref:Myb-like domain-containing protein n=1 Tax=Tagetes erecta TaxID=13708 RepID=A0AAD8PBL7_TARER|nr:hypothetical protein QVD17_05546 [Tagetes erecta]
MIFNKIIILTIFLFLEAALAMDWTENQQCVQCDKGGNLLVCSDDGCPISVHKNCMGCDARFDDVGNFHCPYCVYKQHTAEAIRLRSKVMLTKKALSAFLEAKPGDGNRQEPVVEMGNKEDEISLQDKLVGEHHSVSLDAEMRDDDCQEPVVEMANKEVEISLKDKLVDEHHSVSLDAEMRDNNHREPVVEMADKNIETSSKDKVVDENHPASLENADEIQDILVPETPNEVSSQNEGVDGVKNVNTCTVMVVYKPNSDHADASNQLQSDVRKRMKLDQQTGNGECKFKVVDQAKESKGADILLTTEKKITFKFRNKSVTFNMNGRKEEHVKEQEAKMVSKQLSMIDRNKRCRRVFWSEQEEEMLKEGVQKYSLETKKNLPWKKILEFGRHVFDSSRTPSELKDKWRYIK